MCGILLFDGDGFCEISRLVNVVALIDRGVVREQLHRNCRNHRHEHFAYARHTDQIIRSLAVNIGLFVTDDDGHSAARLDLFNIGNRLFEQSVLRSDGDNGHTVRDQRDRTVLELACRVALGVNVGYLLELERSLEG